MKAVGLDKWPRFVTDAQARARDPATVAATLKSLQPPDLNKDAITPVYPVEKALAVAATGVTGGVLGVARAIGGAVASRILGEKQGPAATGPSAAPALAKEVAPEKPAQAPLSPPEEAPSDPSAASVWDKLYRYTLNPNHPEGGSKAEWFSQALGFTRSNIGDLAKQIVLDPSQATQTGEERCSGACHSSLQGRGANESR
jgi:hypothetical protein